MKKGSRLYAILKMKCPRCQESEIFLDPNPYHLKNVGKMHRRCPNCDLSFIPEPGFYFGAAYVSYFFSVSLAIIMGLFLYITGVRQASIFIIGITLLLLLAAPLVFRLSRAAWLAIFVGFDPRYTRKDQED